MEKNTYKKALVVFIDILGTKDKNYDELKKIQDIFHGELDLNQKRDREYTIYERVIHSFSDCAYIFYYYKDDNHENNMATLIDIALVNCAPTLMLFLNAGFLVRGGIAYGDAYFEKDSGKLFGTAVNEAYNLENKEAIFPRIVFSKDIVRFISENPADLNSFVKTDKDGYKYFNYLKLIEEGIDFSEILTTSNEEFIKNALALCSQEQEKNNVKEAVKLKYEWLNEYLKNIKYADPDVPFVWKKEVLDIIDKFFNDAHLIQSDSYLDVYHDFKETWRKNTVSNLPFSKKDSFLWHELYKAAKKLESYVRLKEKENINAVCKNKRNETFIKDDEYWNTLSEAASNINKLCNFDRLLTSLSYHKPEVLSEITNMDEFNKAIKANFIELMSNNYSINKKWNEDLDILTPIDGIGNKTGNGK